jgi:hypothetical protein
MIPLSHVRSVLAVGACVTAHGNGSHMLFVECVTRCNALKLAGEDKGIVYRC